MFRFDYGDCDTSNSFELFHYRIFPRLLSSGKFKIRKFDEFLTFIFDLLMRSWQSVKKSSNWNIHQKDEENCKQSQFKAL